MANIGLIADSSVKLTANYSQKEFSATEMFSGNSYKKSIEEGLTKFKCERYYILSGKYHLLKPGDTISYYNVGLNKMNESNKKAWACQVLMQLIEEEKKGNINLGRDTFYFFGGENYYKYLRYFLNCVTFEYENSNSITFKVKKRYKVK